MTPSRATRTRIGVDIGGTFTDLAWVDDVTGAVQVGKLLTTPKDPSQTVEQDGVTLLNDAGGNWWGPCRNSPTRSRTGSTSA